MKLVKQCLLTTLVFFSHAQANPQTPFSPCSTDMPVIIQNNISDAMSDICSCLQIDTDQSPALDTATDQRNNSDRMQRHDITKYANIAVEVNNKPLKLGQKMALNVNDKQPLVIRISSDLWSILDYLIELDLVRSCVQKSNDIQSIKDWTVSLLRYTYCLFDESERSAEHVYEKHKTAFLLTYAKAYKNTFGLLGGTLTIEIPIDAKKLKNEVIVNPHDPTIDFYDVLDIVVSRFNEPEHINFTGSLHKPVIQIV